MNYKWIGAVLIIAGCGGTGVFVATNHRREEALLKQLRRILEFMECELQYRLTPLPELCRSAAGEETRMLNEVLLNLARELDWQSSPDVSSCMNAALTKSRELPARVKKLLVHFGHVLGRFDLSGQLQGIRSVRGECTAAIKKLSKDKDIRLRSYQTLGLCAGAALVILLA